MVERALSFGGAAAAYERFRTGYPDELVDKVLEYADRPVRTALEIGAGTGKATRVFAARGIAVTATEPDMRQLRRTEELSLNAFRQRPGDNGDLQVSEPELFQAERDRKQSLRSTKYYYRGKPVTAGPFAKTHTAIAKR